MTYQLCYQSLYYSPNPNISVIIPCFNSELYVTRCISSVLNQVQVDLELIIVDDGSTDNTLHQILSIVREHTDCFIKVFTTKKPSGSPGTPRNFGLSNAVGEFIQFVDSDDWLDANYLASMYQKASTESCDICFSSGFFNWQCGQKTIRNYGVHTMLDRSLPTYGYHESFMVWDKLWRRLFLIENKLVIDPLICSEEIPFILKAYYLSHKNFVCTDLVGYNYNRGNPHSISSRIRGKTDAKNELLPWELVLNASFANNTGYKDVIRFRMLTSLLFAYDSSTSLDFRGLIRKEISLIVNVFSQELINLASSLKKYYVIKRARSIVADMNTTVLFLPDWSKENPYQADLYEALSSSRGYIVKGISPNSFTKHTAKNLISGINTKNIVLHFHWLHCFYDASSQHSVDEFINKVDELLRHHVSIVWTCHNILPHDCLPSTRSTHIYVRNYISKVAARVIIHSQQSIQSLGLAGIHVDENKLFIAPHGLYQKHLSSVTPMDPSNERKNNEVANRQFTLLLFGRIRKYKGFELFVEKFVNSRYIFGNIKLVVAGPVDSRKISERITSLASNHSSRILLRFGFQSDEDVRYLFLNSDLIVLPYLKGMTSGVEVLAKTFRKPIVYSSQLSHLSSEWASSLCIDFTDPSDLVFAYISSILLSIRSNNDFFDSSLLETSYDDLKWFNIVSNSAYCFSEFTS